MKKILSFLMALTMVLGLNAAPVALKQQKALKSASRHELVQKLKATQPVAHQTAVKHAPKNVRHIDRTAIRKAPMAATTVTFAPADFEGQGTSGTGSAVSTTKDGVTVSTDLGYGHASNLRVYNGGTLTISATATITKIEFVFNSEDKDGNLETVYTPNATSWSVTTTEQARINSLVVTLGGEVPPTPPTGDVEITGLNYVDAIYYDGFWDFDFYNDYNYEEYYYIYPELYYQANEEATSGTSIVGTWTLYWGGYWKAANDSVMADEEEPVGSLTITCVEQGIYNFVGSFVGTDGKTYTWTLNNVEVYAYNGETYEDITLTDGGDGPTPTPGDTTFLADLDAFEFDYYGSYSEEGAYNYTLVLYNSLSEEYVPQVGFDIYTEVKDEFTGIFSVENGNLGLDYCAFFPNAESEGEDFTDASVTIEEGEGDDLVIEGIFTTEAGKTYTFFVTAEPYIYDAEHPYEPQEAKTFNLTAVGGEVNETYFAEYGIVYYYLDMADGSYVGLTYRTVNGTQPKGTFAISDEEGVDAFLTGMDLFGDSDGSYYETIEGYVYYLVSGSVTLATDEEGNTTITVNATSFYGSTFTITGVISAPQPTPGHTIVIADYAAVSFTTLDGAYTVLAEKAGASNDPAYNSNSKDLRIYANGQLTLTKNTKDGPMTKITFCISDKGLARQADIAVSTGEIVSYDMDNALVTWTGEASEVVFTVGDKATHGSDGASAAGQFDFTAIDIESGATGFIPTKANKVADKCFFNGQLMIIKNEAVYNFQGNLVK